jgi:hypothetical protein
VRYLTSSKTGASAAIRTYSFGVTDRSSQFMTSELWVCDANTYCTTWTEAGWHVGIRIASSLTSVAWFWGEEWQSADCYHSYCFKSHFNGGDFSGCPIVVGEWHTAKISYYTDGRWRIFCDGTQIGITAVGHNHSQTSDDIRVGSETNDPGGTVAAEANGLQKRLADNVTWNYTWTDSILQRVNGNPNPFVIEWLNRDDWARWFTN